jgi:uncharacterized membrane-anchored protein YhcB (DUF1043 family)
MATGQEQSTFQFLDIFLKWANVAVGAIVSLFVVVLRLTLKHRNDKITESEMRLNEKFKTFADEMHISFKNISEGLKTERAFWQEILVDLKGSVKNLVQETSSNTSTIEGLRKQIDSELKRLDQSIKDFKDLCEEKHSKL